MSMQFFVKPYDIFMPRGNSHFGVNSGDFGQIRMLPAPSIFAGAFRSFIASRKPAVLKAIMAGKKPEEVDFAKVLGSFEDPGTFRIDKVCMCRKTGENIEPLFPVPGDIVIFDDKDGVDVRTLVPHNKPAFIDLGNELPMTPVLKAPARKPVGGYWLNESGYKKYLAGQKLDKDDLLKESSLWKKEMRVGIALSSSTRAVEEGQLYSAEAVSLNASVGFLVAIDGADAILGNCGDLSLGGDQRAAHFCRVSASIAFAELKKIEQEKRFKLFLTAPAIFANGWLPDNIVSDNGVYYLKAEGCSARLVCAAIKGSETLSGWNMVVNAPKTAMRTVPAGSVYWFTDLTGDVNALKNMVEAGLWHSSPDRQRVAEGYNRAELAAYEIR